MNTKKAFLPVLVAFVVAPMIGCMPKMTIEDMKAMRPERPAELDKLDALVGTWKGTSTANVTGIDEELKGTGESTIAWEADGWVLVERAKYESEMGTFHGVGVWTYDMNAKKFRVHWFDDWGGVASGTATHDEETDKWTMQYKSKGPMGDTTGAGSFTMVDENTMEWTWEEWDGLKLNKYMEMSGTSKKQ